MIPLLANFFFLSLSSLLQRSYTLIVEALDSNNETSGEYLSTSGNLISLFVFDYPPIWEKLCVEGHKRKFILSDLPVLFNVVLWGVRVCPVLREFVDRCL